MALLKLGYFEKATKFEIFHLKFDATEYVASKFKNLISNSQNILTILEKSFSSFYLIYDNF